MNASKIAPLIGIAGPAGSGKTTVARLMCRPYDGGFTRISLAGTLKNMLRTMGLTEEQVNGCDKNQPCALLGGKTPRHAMQTLGTQWGRDCIDPDLWLRIALAKTQHYRERDQPVVIDDVRFDNEAQAIQQAGGFVVVLHRTGVQASAAHASEVGLFSFDVTILNNTSPEAAYAAVLNEYQAFLCT